MTSDKERREVAKRLRQMADAHHAVEASRVARALGLEYKVYGSVIAFNSADLIDRPTCFDTEGKDSKSFTCSACGFSESKLVVSPFTLSFLWVKHSYCYCPNCGTEIIDG